MVIAMKYTACLPLFALLLLGCGDSTPSADDDSEAPVSDNAVASGDWVLLFNGNNLDGWHSYNEKAPRPAWIVEDGAIVLDVDNASNERLGGDLISDARFENFELELEWKISPGGNSGIFFGVRELEGTYDGYITGLEMQVLDNNEHPDGQNPISSAGASYGLYPPSENVVRPVGEYNQVRLVVDHGKIEHWLNGVMITSYDLDSEDWANRIANSKFKDWEHFAKYRKGHIGLQDHTDKVWYRNIRIREL